MIVLLVLALAAATPEAEALGLRLAKSAGFSLVEPTSAANDIEELVKTHPELTVAEKDQLRATARRVINQETDKIVTALGHNYTENLSIDDLRALVAVTETVPYQHYRAAMPALASQAVNAASNFDLKGETITAFCGETGKACPKK
jgi:hypothetical protein